MVTGAFNGLPGDFELDTGDAGPAIIEGYWAEQHGLGASLATGMAWSGSGAGGTYNETLSRADLSLGLLKLPHEIVSYVGVVERGSEASRMQAGVVGESSLYRFDMTYNYAKGQVWIDPQTRVPPRRAEGSAWFPFGSPRFFRSVRVPC
jgi:hypothetical protein